MFETHGVSAYAVSAPAPGVVEIAGDVDIAACPRLNAVLLAAFDDGVREVAVDASRVEFIDARAIGVLIGAANMARDAGGFLTLRQPSRVVRRLVDLLELDGALPVERAADNPSGEPQSGVSHFPDA